MARRVSDAERKKQREQVIKAAATLFSQRGFDGTTVQEIAAQVGVSDAQVLRLFGGKKENLAFAVFDYYWTKVNVRVREVSGDSTKNAREKLLLLFREILNEIGPAASFGTIFILQGKLAGEPGRQLVKTALTELACLIDGIVGEGQRQGVLRNNLAVEAIRQQLIGCAQSVLLSWAWKERVGYPANYTPDEACHTFEAVLSGISTSASK
jgi:AcrR family transcriptional regulator